MYICWTGGATWYLPEDMTMYICCGAAPPAGGGAVIEDGTRVVDGTVEAPEYRDEMLLAEAG